MYKLKSLIQGYDIALITSVLGLMAIGLISLFSTSQPEMVNFYKQVLWIGIGLGLMVLFSAFDYRLFKIHSAPVLVLYFIGIAGLLAVLFFGTPVRGARSWIQLGPVNIETVEILKIIIIFILAKYFSIRHVEIYRFRHIVISGIYVLIPSVLVLLQPDIGSFAILAAIWAGIMIIAGIKLKHLATLAIIAVIVGALAWSLLLLDYQKARVATFLNPDADPYGAGYNSRQAIIAVGSGGLWGKGFGQGSQAQLGFLPEAETDFIYAAIIEEFGLFMGIAVLFLYAVFFWRAASVVKNAPDNFAKLAVLGISVMLAVQLFLNIAMNFTLAPITGITLPFVSYGGSSLISLLIAVGIIQNIHRNSIQKSITQEISE